MPLGYIGWTRLSRIPLGPAGGAGGSVEFRVLRTARGSRRSPRGRARRPAAALAAGLPARPRQPRRAGRPAPRGGLERRRWNREPAAGLGLTSTQDPWSRTYCDLAGWLRPAARFRGVRSRRVRAPRRRRRDAGARKDKPEEAASTFRRALSLWRGPPLAEFAYEPWAQPEIERLEELRLEALQKRIESDLALGASAELVGELELLVGQYPLRERLRAQLMLALYRSGRQAEALAAYRDARAGARGGARNRAGARASAARAAILDQDPALELPSTAPAVVRPWAES